MQVYDDRFQAESGLIALPSILTLLSSTTWSCSKADYKPV